MTRLRNLNIHYMESTENNSVMCPPKKRTGRHHNRPNRLAEEVREQIRLHIERVTRSQVCFFRTS
jgi:hypothetical protein